MGVPLKKLRILIEGYRKYSGLRIGVLASHPDITMNELAAGDKFCALDKEPCDYCGHPVEVENGKSNSWETFDGDRIYHGDCVEIVNDNSGSHRCFC